MPRGRVAGILMVLLFLAPAVWGGWTALRLTRAAWPVAAALDEPIVKALIGEHAKASTFERSATLARRDFSYARERATLAQHEAHQAGWAGSFRVEVREWFGEAARRAPTDAETRFHLSGAAWRCGDEAEADRQARAALHLAPLYRDLRARVGEYFLSRFRETRDERYLRDAVRAHGDVGEDVLEDPLLSLAQVRAAFEAARVPEDRQLACLEASGRWDWAIEVAELRDRRSGEGRDREAGVRARLAGDLLGSGRRAAALRQALLAHDLDASSVKDPALLGRALLAVGREPAGREALSRSLDGPEGVARIDGALIEDGVSASWRFQWWTDVVREGRGGDEARLARAKAALAEGGLPEAHPLLVELVESRAVGPETCFTLARAHAKAGHRRIARKYARQAAERAPDRPEYRRLSDELARRDGR